MAVTNWKKIWLATFFLILEIILMAGMRCSLFMLNCFHYIFSSNLLNSFVQAKLKIAVSFRLFFNKEIEVIFAFKRLWC